MDILKVKDLIDLLTIRLGEISSSADCLGITLFHEFNQDQIYKAAYAIKFMTNDLENKVTLLAQEIIRIENK